MRLPTHLAVWALVLALIGPVSGVGRPLAHAREDKLPRVGVIVLSTGSTPASAADNLTEILIAAISQMDRYEIVGKEEFQSILGVQSERRALTCLHDTTCLSKVGLELGIAEVIVGNVSQRADVWSLVLDRVDVRRSKVIRHLFHDTDKGEEELLSSVFGLADKLFAVEEETPEPPKPPDKPRPPPTPPEASSGNTLKYATYGSLGLGVVLGAAAAVYGLRVRNAAAEVTGRCCIEGTGARQIYDMTREDALDTRDDVESFTSTANVLFGVSAAALGTGLALWYLAPDDAASPSAGVVPVRGGGFVTVGAGF